MIYNIKITRQMKRLSVLLLSIVLLYNNSTAQNHKFENNKINCSYETKYGRMNGLYISYYKNGQKKAEGKFENNCRIGKWTVYDSTGRTRMLREYLAPCNYTQTIFQNTAAAPKEMTSSYNYKISYNSYGYIDYFKLDEKMVVWAKRIWRYIAPKDNKIIFENNLLFDLLIRNLAGRQITAYKDDEFSIIDSIKQDASSYKVICYKIKEDCVLDNVRSLLETRIIGLCPVVINVQKKDTIDLCWLYFPEIRKILAQEKINKGNQTYIKTLDDLFFYRDFYGQIYKEGNVYDRPINSYKTSKTEIDKESERIEISIIESEHDFWLDMSKK